jgi:hypothetical protein
MEISDGLLAEVWKDDIMKLYKIEPNHPVKMVIDWECMNKIHPFEDWKKKFYELNQNTMSKTSNKSRVEALKGWLHWLVINKKK